MNQAALVRRLQTAAGLRNDFDRAFDGEVMAGLADEMVQSRARKERHDKVRLLLAVFFEFTDVEDFDNVGMAHRGEHITLFVEQLQRRRIWNIEDCLDSDFAPDDGVVGAINQAHPALPEDLPDLVATR